MISIVSNSFGGFNVCSCMLMKGKLEICPVRGKIRNFPMFGGNQISKFPVIKKETEAIMVLSKYGDRDSLKRGRYHWGV